MIKITNWTKDAPFCTDDANIIGDNLNELHTSQAQEHIFQTGEHDFANIQDGRAAKIAANIVYDPNRALYYVESGIGVSYVSHEGVGFVSVGIESSGLTSANYSVFVTPMGEIDTETSATSDNHQSTYFDVYLFSGSSVTDMGFSLVVLGT